MAILKPRTPVSFCPGERAKRQLGAWQLEQMGQMEQTDWGLPEAAVSWLGLKVLDVQDVLSLPIPDTYHCFLLFYVAVFARSGWGGEAGVEESISSACHFKVQNVRRASFRTSSHALCFQH